MDQQIPAIGLIALVVYWGPCLGCSARILANFLTTILRQRSSNFTSCVGPLHVLLDLPTEPIEARAESTSIIYRQRLI
eukprot:scaffold90348_cov51-Cyclotella_meneghiniana.AAC.2